MDLKPQIKNLRERIEKDLLLNVFDPYPLKNLDDYINIILPKYWTTV